MMEQEPNYGRQREPGDEAPTEGAEPGTEQSRLGREPEAETRYNETSDQGEQSYRDTSHDAGYDNPGHGDSGYGHGGTNYGPHSYEDQRYGGGGMGMAGTMSPQDERTWSIISHLSVLASLIGLPVVGPLIVWLIYRDRSPMVRFHSVQALWYQLAWLGILIAYSIISLILTIVLVGFLMFFLLPVLGLIPVVHGCYAAYKISQGEDFRYPIIADMIDNNNRSY